MYFIRVFAETPSQHGTVALVGESVVLIWKKLTAGTYKAQSWDPCLTNSSAFLVTVANISLCACRFSSFRYNLGPGLQDRQVQETEGGSRKTE